MFSLRLIYCFRYQASCVFQQNLGSCLQLDFGSSLFFLFLLFFFLCYISADTENHADIGAVD